MYFIIGAVVIGAFALSAVYLKHRLERSVTSEYDAIDTSRHTPVRNWQFYLMVFLSAPAAIAGGDAMINHYFLSDSYLPDVGLACAWAALISNTATVAILYRSSKSVDAADASHESNRIVTELDYYIR